MAALTRLANLSEIRRLKPEWDDLLKRTSNTSIFMTWEWLATWWEVYGKGHELWWLTVKDENKKLIASAPLYLRKHQNGLFLPHRELRFIGTGAPVAPEHLDLLTDPQNSEEAIQLIGQYLADHSSDWDVLCLSDISSPNSAAFQLDRCLSEKGATFVMDQQMPSAPYISLPVSWEEYFKSLGSRMRAHIPRLRRKVERELGATFSVWPSGNGNLHFAFSEFERLFSARKMSVGIGNKFEEMSGYRQFHHRLIERFSERGWLYLGFLKSPTKMLAAEYNFKYSNILYSYQFGFDPDYAKKNVFKVLRSYVIEDAIRQGMTEFDLLRGEESYKKDWNAIPRKKQMLRCFGATFYGRTLRRVLELRRTGKKMLHKVITR